MKAALSDLPGSIRVVSFTGGEPFARPRRLLRLLREVSGSGRTSTVVTNALWARDWDSGEQLLVKAFHCGLRGVSISLDDYHRPKVPLNTVACLLRHARMLGMVVNVKGIGKKSRQRVSRLRSSGVLSGQPYAEAFYDLENVGEAASLSADVVRRPELGGCLSVFAPLVSPDGGLYACCSARVMEIDNPVLFRGSVRTEAAGELLEKASRDYLLASLAVLGPAGLVEILREEVHSGVDTRCELCVSLLNRENVVLELQGRIASDKKLRKDIVGRHMLFESIHKQSMLSSLYST